MIINSKKILEVLPKLSGTDVKVIMYIICMAQDNILEMTQTEIANNLGISVTSVGAALKIADGINILKKRNAYIEISKRIAISNLDMVEKEMFRV